MGGMRAVAAGSAGVGVRGIGNGGRGMSEYWQSRLVKAGIILLIVGTGPLLFIIIAASIGVWPDPNPNPVGPGLLAALTFWPAMICVVIGVMRVRHARKAAAE